MYFPKSIFFFFFLGRILPPSKTTPSKDRTTLGGARLSLSLDLELENLDPNHETDGIPIGNVTETIFGHENNSRPPEEDPFTIM